MWSYLGPKFVVAILVYVVLLGLCLWAAPVTGG